MAAHVRAMLAFQRAGAVVFDYGNNLRAAGPGGRRRGRLRLPGLRARVHPAAVLRGPRTVPLGGAVGRPGGHPPDRPGRSSSSSPTTPGCAAGSRWPRRACRSRACRRGSAGWATASGRRPGWPSTSSSGPGEVAAPIVIGRDHLDSGSVASPNRETEAMATARTPSPTGRSSTRWSTPRPARRGSPSTTAAASGSATRSTPGWSSSPTARRWPPRSSSAS